MAVYSSGCIRLPILLATYSFDCLPVYLSAYSLGHSSRWEATFEKIVCEFITQTFHIFYDEQIPAKKCCQNRRHTNVGGELLRSAVSQSAAYAIGEERKACPAFSIERQMRPTSGPTSGPTSRAKRLARFRKYLSKIKALQRTSEHR